jgi:hypothetical protein
VREVTKRAIASCFKEKQSVMLVPGIPHRSATSHLFRPGSVRELVQMRSSRGLICRRLCSIGGQREMVYTSTTSKRIDLYTKHTGFIRMAMQHGASLVPVFTYAAKARRCPLLTCSLCHVALFCMMAPWTYMHFMCPHQLLIGSGRPRRSPISGCERRSYGSSIASECLSRTTSTEDGFCPFRDRWN